MIINGLFIDLLNWHTGHILHVILFSESASGQQNTKNMSLNTNYFNITYILRSFMKSGAYHEVTK